MVADYAYIVDGVDDFFLSIDSTAPALFPPLFSLWQYVAREMAIIIHCCSMMIWLPSTLI